MKVSKNQKTRRSCLTIVIGMFLAVLSVTITAASTVKSILEHYAQELPDVSTLSHYEPSLTTKIFSADGQLIGTLYKENRTWTKLEDVSVHLKNAVLAIEDSRFYEHHGVDPIGVGRAIYAEVKGAEGKQGASTVTMQLARALFLNPKQSIDRKLKEVLLAIQIEKSYTKNEILELYLNQIYLGSGAYGVHAASSLYFAKRPKDLTPAEASLIAGLPQAPSEYSPLYDQEAAKDRQRLVLRRMADLEYISWEEYRAALEEVRKMKFKQNRKNDHVVLKVPYFTTYVIKQLHNQFDEDFLYRGGLKVYTTVDLKLQKKAEKIVRELVKKDEPYLNVHTGAMVSVQNGTGFIRAMVGGTDWTVKNQFNRAWQTGRHPGSSFKIFVYATALECGYTPSTIVADSPIQIGSWAPKNSDHRFMGSIPLSTAMQYSRNVVAVRVMQHVGIQRVIDTAHALGITSQLQPFLSLALGATELSPLEMADAVSTIPNLGIRVPATPIKIIYDKDDNIVMDNRFPKKKDVMSESTAVSMMEMMRNVVRAGTATRAYLENHEAAGKTGTTDSFRDAWFVGYTRDYTTAVWVGNDDYSKMWRSFGGDLPAHIWHEYMKFALKDTKPSKLPIHEMNKKSVLLCADTKMRIGPKCPRAIRKEYPKWNIPARYCGLHGAPKVVPTTAKKDDGRKEPPKKPEAAPKPEAIDAPIPTQIELPTEVPLSPPPDAPIGEIPPAPPAEVVPEPIPVEVPAQPVELPPAPEPVVIPVAPPPAPPPAAAPPPAPVSAPPAGLPPDE